MKNYIYLLILFLNVNKNVEKKYDLTDYFYGEPNKENIIKINYPHLEVKNCKIKINQFINDKLSDYLLQFISIWGNDSKIKIEHEAWNK